MLCQTACVFKDKDKDKVNNQKETFNIYTSHVYILYIQTFIQLRNQTYILTS
jgi:hypothetical protein